MSFTNHTPNYNLPQYVGTDKPTFLGDFNNAMSTIDTALHNNEQNAGEGLSELQQAQAALTETQETLTEVQTEVANVSGIAANVNTNVQQALSAANDATTAANNATSQIQPAVTAANKASADAQAAQQVANGNVATLTELSERVTQLENSPKELKKIGSLNAPSTVSGSATLNVKTILPNDYQKLTTDSFFYRPTRVYAMSNKYTNEDSLSASSSPSFSYDQASGILTATGLRGGSTQTNEKYLNCNVNLDVYALV